MLTDLSSYVKPDVDAFDGYRELGKGRGVFRSADGLRQFRMDPDSMQGNHWPDIPHVHFEIFEPGGKKAVVNNHVPLVD